MAYSSGRPERSRDLVPSPSEAEYDVPIVTAALNHTAVLQRQEAASVEPVIETRRERRERELAAASASASVASELVAAPAVRTATSAPVSRREIRGVSDLEHLLGPARPSARRVQDARPAAEARQAAKAAVARPAVAPAFAATAMSAEPVAAKPVAAKPVAPDLAAATATSVRSITFSHADDTRPRTAVSAPRGARSSVSAPNPRRRVLPTKRGGASGPHSRKRTIINTVVMVATAGLVATIALPAYAYDADNSPRISASSQLGIQSLTVSGVNSQASARDDYTSTGDVAAMDSTMGTTVSPTVQALAAELVADVAAGKLVGSVPDHIVEIRNLANGVAAPGCGVDYRVLQTIKVAVDNFSKVGVSDINRHCTGQIEGAGTASSHYKDGGGHAVDFYILNGHGLTGADADSLKLIQLLDPMVPPGSGLGQASCGRSISVTNFAPFDDTCTHLHVDFGAARGVSLTN